MRVYMRAYVTWCACPLDWNTHTMLDDGLDGAGVTAPGATRGMVTSLSLLLLSRSLPISPSGGAGPLPTGYGGVGYLA